MKSDDVQQIRSKLLAAETKIDELKEENNDLNREIRNMEQEMRDNFRYEIKFKLKIYLLITIFFSYVLQFYSRLEYK